VLPSKNDNDSKFELMRSTPALVAQGLMKSAQFLHEDISNARFILEMGFTELLAD